MREFVYYSRGAVTTGNFDDPKSAGRLDIVSHIVIMSFFLSNAERNNIHLHLFFDGPPNPPAHLEISSGDTGLDTSVSKKDVLGLIKRMLYQLGDKKHEPFPGCFVEKKSIVSFIEEKAEEGRDIFMLDEKGDDIRSVEIDENPIFIMADHEGFPKKLGRRLKKSATPVSIGDFTYFASQTMVVVQNELDRRKLF